MAACLALSCSSEARDITFDDIRKLEGRSEQMRARNFIRVIRDIKAKRGAATYAEVFLCANAYFRRGNYKESIRWFARAHYHKHSDLPASYGSGDVSKYLKKSKKRSPLSQEALYMIALAYQKMGHVNDPPLIISKIKKPGPVVEEKSLNLLAEIATKKGGKETIKAYQKLVSKFPKATYYLRLGYYHEKQNQHDEALKTYLKILQYEKITWALSSAAKKVRASLITKGASSDSLNVADRIRYAEALRLARMPAEAHKVWQKIKLSTLKDNLKHDYLLKYSRTLVSRGKFDSVIGLLNQYLNRLPERTRSAWVGELGTGLVRAGRYGYALRVIPKDYDNAKTLRQRIRALHALNHQNRFNEAIALIKNYKTDDLLPENVAFKVCLKDLLRKRDREAETCLMKLRDATVGLKTGGRSRYYLAKIWLRHGKKEKANEMLQEVYLNSPDSSYAYRALRTLGRTGSDDEPPSGKRQIRRWLAESGLEEDWLKQFFEKKRRSDDYAVDSFWQDWQDKLEALETKSSLREVRAAMFIALGMSSWANKELALVKNFARERDALLRQKVGIATRDAHLMYYHMKRYLKINQKQVDFFFLSKLAMECLYPTPYLKEIKKNARRNNIEVAAIYALMRQESQYHTGATSRSNAKGLLQILPSTGRYVNRKLKIPAMNLYNPTHNIMLGTKFFSDLSRQFNNNFDLVASAYNGGPGRLSRWLRSISYQDLELFFEQIPYRETYYYQKITRGNYDRYRLLLSHMN